MSYQPGARDGDTEAASGRAIALIDIGRYEQALTVIAQALLSAPGDCRLHCDRALALLHLDRPEEAGMSADQAIANSPHEPWAHRLRASALCSQARKRQPPWRLPLGLEARASAREAQRLRPDDANTYCTLVDAELLAGDWRAANEAALKAVQLAPSLAAGYIAVAQVALVARDFRTAKAAAEQALAIDPANYLALNGLGAALAGLSRWKEAATTFATAGRLNPTAEPARQHLSRIGALFVRGALLCCLAPLLVLPHGPVVFILIACGSIIAIGHNSRILSALNIWDLRVGLRFARLSEGRARSAPEAVGPLSPTPPQPNHVRTSLIVIPAAISWLVLAAAVASAFQPAQKQGEGTALWITGLVSAAIAIWLTIVLVRRIPGLRRRGLD